MSLLLATWTVPSMGLPLAMLPGIFLCMSFLGIYTFFSWKYLGVELLGHRVDRSILVLVDPAKPFSENG